MCKLSRYFLLLANIDITALKVKWKSGKCRDKVLETETEVKLAKIDFDTSDNEPKKEP